MPAAQELGPEAGADPGTEHDSGDGQRAGDEPFAVSRHGGEQHEHECEQVERRHRAEATPPLGHR